MKADEYAKIARAWIANPPPVTDFYVDVPELHQDHKADLLDMQCEIVKRLFNEVKVIADVRKAKSPEALRSIMLELEQKWQAICRRLEANGRSPFSKDTFMAMVDVYLEKGDNIFVARTVARLNVGRRSVR